MKAISTFRFAARDTRSAEGKRKGSKKEEGEILVLICSSNKKAAPGNRKAAGKGKGHPHSDLLNKTKKLQKE
jgi:hypothetical protein